MGRQVISDGQTNFGRRTNNVMYAKVNWCLGKICQQKRAVNAGRQRLIRLAHLPSAVSLPLLDGSLVAERLD